MKYTDETIYVKDGLNISDKIGSGVSDVGGNLEGDINIIDDTDTINDEGSFGFGKDILVEDEEENFGEKEVKEEKNIGKDSVKEKEEENLEMSVVGVYVLDKFSKFNLKKVEDNSSLFDLTNEYPEKYVEYDSKDLVLYYFPNKNYSGVLSIFEAISYDLPFIINKKNNFFGESFYINIKEDFGDSYVRLVINYKNNIFGLKISKDKYNDVKDILNEF